MVEREDYAEQPPVFDSGRPFGEGSADQPIEVDSSSPVSRLDAARGLAREGFRVFPVWHVEGGRCACPAGSACQSPGKHPVIANWQYEATCDESTIIDWWRDHDWNVGISCQDLVVLDVDPRNGGPKALSSWQSAHGVLLTTRRHASGGGGTHLIFSKPEAAEIRNGKFVDGVDVKTDGGFIVGPGSTHVSGQHYEVLEPDDGVAELPAAVLEYLTERQSKRTARQRRAHRGRAGEWWLTLPVEEAVRAALEGGLPVGSRDAGTFLLLCRMRRTGRWSKAECFSLAEKIRLVSDQPEDQPFTAEEARSKVEQAWQVPFLMDDAREDGATFNRWLRFADEATTTADHRHLTDDGNALRFVDRYGAELRYVERWKKWLHWDGTRWSRDDPGATLILARDAVRSIYGEAAGEPDAAKRAAIASWAKQSESHARILAIPSLARGDARVVARPDQFDTDPLLLNCRNGTLDLRTGSLRPANPDDNITQLAPVEFHPGAACPRWDWFLTTVFGGDADLIAYVQRGVGYSLTGEVREHCMFILHGSGRNGKSTFIEVLTKVLGDYAHTASMNVLIAKRGESETNPGMMNLFRKRFASAIETKEGGRFDERVVKTLTGGDRRTGRGLYENEWSYDPTEKLWVGTNHKPTIADDSEAMWSRLRLIPFSVFIPPEQRDKTLAARLIAEEAPGILRWAVEGCLDWQANGLGEAAVVTRATSDYRLEEDTVSAFIAECCSEASHDHTLWVRSTVLYAHYERWCEANRVVKVSNRGFNDRLRQRSLVKDRPGSALPDGTRAQCWWGIRLTSGAW